MRSFGPLPLSAGRPSCCVPCASMSFNMMSFLSPLPFISPLVFIFRDKSGRQETLSGYVHWILSSSTFHDTLWEKMYYTSVSVPVMLYNPSSKRPWVSGKTRILIEQSSIHFPFSCKLYIEKKAQSIVPGWKTRL